MSQATIDVLKSRMKGQNEAQKKVTAGIIKNLEDALDRQNARKKRDAKLMTETKARIDKALGRSSTNVAEMKAGEAKKHVMSIEDFDELQKAREQEESRKDGGRGSVLDAIDAAEAEFEDED